MQVHLRLASNCLLGEGISWHAEVPSFLDGAYLFVDIHGRLVHAYSPYEERHQQWASPERIGWLIETTVPGVLMAGMQSGFARVRLGQNVVEVIDWPARVYAQQPALRLNDAKADAHGRIWAGSLNNYDESLPQGELFCLSAGMGVGGAAQLTCVDQGYCVANGPAIHPNGQWMLHTDSARRTIYAFDLDMARGQLSGKRVWKILSETEGYPDGMTFDAQGRLWLAHWGAGLVSQYEADGSLRQRVQLPVSNVTNLAFGGKNLDRLHVTTAKAGLSEQALGQQPMAGGLFELTGHSAIGCPVHSCLF
jgi:sugar lactone lactonase YvrE